MNTTAMASRVAAGTGTPCSSSQSTSRSEKFSAAKALPRKSDRVMATWMVARNRAGWLVSWARRTARLSPWAARWASFASLTEITAISALAKMALRAMSATCKRIMPMNEPSNEISSFTATESIPEKRQKDTACRLQSSAGCIPLERILDITEVRKP